MKYSVTGLIVLSIFLSFQMSAQAFVACQSAFKNRIVIVSGTARFGSNTLKVSNMVSEYIANQIDLEAANAEVEVIDLFEWRLREAQELAAWSETDRSNPPPDFWNTSEYFKGAYETSINLASTMVVVHPEYNMGISGDLKLFLDRLSIGSFEGKNVFTFGVAAGPRAGLVPQEQLHSTLAKRGAEYSQKNRIEVGGIDNLVEVGEIPEDDPRFNYTKGFFENLIRTILASTQD